nr:SPOCS domain-containing protein [uncultured Oscillibacter sp.]
MELELKKACFDAYEAAGELTLTQEETAETIVPDYCPDIARIIETTGKVFLHSREIRDGRAEISGTVRVTVLYTPEGEGGIRTLEFAMPFTVETDGRSLPDCAALLADTEPELLETRMLNPRKVFTHCKLVTRLTGYQRRPLCFCTDVEAGPELCIEKKQEQQHAIVLTHIAEKDFTFSEQMDLSPGREGAAEILTSRVNSTVTETKIVGSKLLFKGIFTVSLLYRTADGRCCAASGELPFSQILEVEGAPEGAEPSVRLQFTGADLQVDGADAEGREIAVTLYLHATALLRQTQELTLLSDLYSTAYDLTYDAAPLELTSFREQFTRRQTVREVLEIGVVADSILALSVTCGAVSVSREGAGVVLRTGASVRALYLDEGGVPLVAERSIDVSCQLELPEDCRVAARAVCPEEVQGSLTDRGIEVRFPVDFRAEAAQRVKRVCVSAGKINTDAPKETTGAPSLVLRCLGKQETAWDLAKRYNTTIGVILAANQLETEGDISRDQLLLIPRKRT